MPDQNYTLAPSCRGTGSARGRRLVLLPDTNIGWTRQSTPEHMEFSLLSSCAGFTRLPPPGGYDNVMNSHFAKKTWDVIPSISAILR